MRAFDYYLDPKVIDVDAIDFFTAGQCWALAEVICDHFGWPVVAEGYVGASEFIWTHVLSVRPDGGLVDIQGVVTPHRNSEYQDPERDFVEMARDCWLNLEYGTFSYYRRRSLAVARAFLPTVISEYGLVP